MFVLYSNSNQKAINYLVNDASFILFAARLQFRVIQSGLNKGAQKNVEAQNWAHPSLKPIPTSRRFLVALVQQGHYPEASEIPIHIKIDSPNDTNETYARTYMNYNGHHCTSALNILIDILTVEVHVFGKEPRELVHILSSQEIFCYMFVMVNWKGALH